MNTFDNIVNKSLSFVNKNEYLSAAISIFLILYASIAAPKLPPAILSLFDSPIFKFVILFLIGYYSRHNPTVAIVAAIALMVSLHALNRFKVNNKMLDFLMKNKNGNMQVPESNDMAEIMHEIPVTELQPEMGSCSKETNFRDNFYPQYVEMQPDALMARYNGNDVTGYDPAATYAST